jgi:hypothetical protein
MLVDGYMNRSMITTTLLTMLVDGYMNRSMITITLLTMLVDISVTVLQDYKRCILY